MDHLATLREDVIDGLTTGSLAEEAESFGIHVQEDGSVIARFGTETFRVIVERFRPGR